MIVEPFNAAFFCLLAAAGLAAGILWALLRRRTEKTRRRVLVAICCCNIVLFFVYKGFLSVDRQFLTLSGIDRFNWWNELPLQLCNINMFLIPLGVLTKKRPILGFSFFIAPLGALLALLFPELPFRGYPLALPRMFGFYVTHLTLVVTGLSLAVLGFYRPRYRDIPGILGAFVLLVTGAHLLNTVLRLTVCHYANYFFTYGAAVSALKVMWRLIPVPLLYELPALVILPVYMALVTALMQLGRRRTGAFPGK